MTEPIDVGKYMQTGSYVTLADLPRLKKAYEKARAEGQGAFTFALETKEVEVLTEYAKYMIEYLELVKNKAYEQ